MNGFVTGIALPYCEPPERSVPLFDGEVVTLRWSEFSLALGDSSPWRYTYGEMHALWDLRHPDGRPDFDAIPWAVLRRRSSSPANEIVLALTDLLTGQT